MAERKRPIRIIFCVDEKEKAIIDKKIELSGFRNMGAFYRKMILSGYVLNIDFSPINQLVSLLSHCSNNLNQLARKANSYEAITHEDIEEIRAVLGELHDTNKLLIERIAKL